MAACCVPQEIWFSHEQSCSHRGVPSCSLVILSHRTASCYLGVWDVTCYHLDWVMEKQWGIATEDHSKCRENNTFSWVQLLSNCWLKLWMEQSYAVSIQICAKIFLYKLAFMCICVFEFISRSVMCICVIILMCSFVFACLNIILCLNVCIYLVIYFYLYLFNIIITNRCTHVYTVYMCICHIICTSVSYAQQYLHIVVKCVPLSIKLIYLSECIYDTKL